MTIFDHDEDEDDEDDDDPKQRCCCCCCCCCCHCSRGIPPRSLLPSIWLQSPMTRERLA